MCVWRNLRQRPASVSEEQAMEVPHDDDGTHDSDCSSAHSSAISSDGSFLAEADFASAVAKAAQLSGLTVIGSTVIDPNSGREREKGTPGIPD